MSNVIDFKTPAQLREDLAARDEEIKALKTKLQSVESTEQLLRLQTLDLQDQVAGLITQMQAIQKNLGNILKKLDS